MWHPPLWSRWPPGRTDITVFMEVFAPPRRMIDLRRGRLHRARWFNSPNSCSSTSRSATPGRLRHFRAASPRPTTSWRTGPSAISPRCGRYRLGRWTAICVLTHDHKFDIPASGRGTLKTKVGYIGAMGSRRPRGRVNGACSTMGSPIDQIEQIMAPIGIDIGARTPEETAVRFAPRSSGCGRACPRHRCATAAAPSTRSPHDATRARATRWRPRWDGLGRRQRTSGSPSTKPRPGRSSLVRRDRDLLRHRARPLRGSARRDLAGIRGLPGARRAPAHAPSPRRHGPAGEIGRLVLLHRVGRLVVGEVSVVVVASTPHRGEAFAAAQFCIDTLKHTVPIWKHETWEGGSDWSVCTHDGPGHDRDPCRLVRTLLRQIGE